MQTIRFRKKTLRDIHVDKKTVLVRVDYNVPLAEDGAIADDYRIRASLDTIKYLINEKAKVVLIAHLGRPDGTPNQKESLEQVATRLSELQSAPVAFVPVTVGDQVRQAIKNARPGTITLLENLRFDPGEEANSSEFARELYDAVRPELFVQDGFGVVHRAHASTSAITQFVPSVAGLLLEKEWTSIVGAMEKPKRPLVAVLGGAKVSDKIGVIEAFVGVADRILIGGAMANTFLAHQGYPVGKSKYETGQGDVINKIYAAIQSQGKTNDFIVLPSDVAVGASLDDRRSERTITNVTTEDMILDVGPETIETFSKILADAGTVIWNGTLGMAEKEQFSYGSARVALALATHKDTTSVIGGGDTADFVLGWDAAEGKSFGHVSTGGGASLELMAGKPMPGIDALLDA